MSWKALLDNEPAFLGFLTSRLGNEDAAREALQEAFLKTAVTPMPAREEAKLVAWFYRVLRNSLVDARRHRAFEKRALALVDTDSARSTGEIREPAVCGCVVELAASLPREWADLLQRVDLGGMRVGDYARVHRLRPNTVSVRLHRARRALRERLLASCGTCCLNGCVDCACSPGRHVPAGRL